MEPDLDEAQWHFEVVFDYDEGHIEPIDPVDGEQRVLASVDPGQAWGIRPDTFSRHRAGFEVRTYRRCRRVLMFHHFDELGHEPYLVRSTEFGYVERTAGSFLSSVTQYGYIQTDDLPVARGAVTFLTYEAKSLPPLEFGYSERELIPRSGWSSRPTRQPPCGARPAVRPVGGPRRRGDGRGPLRA